MFNIFGYGPFPGVRDAIRLFTDFEQFLSDRSEALAPAIDRARQTAAASECKAVPFIDDEESLRSTVSKLLRKKGFHVIEAVDGPSAIACFQASGPAGVESSCWT